MTSIDCTDIKAILSPYIDGELDDETRHLAERHLGTCASCRQLVDQAERLDALIASDVEATMPAGLSPDFFGAVMARTVYAEPQTAGVRSRRIATWAGWFAAAAAFALAAGIWVDQNMRTSPGVAMHEQAQTQVAQLPESRLSEQPRADRTLRDDFYSAGIDLQSRTYEGALPAHAFRTASANREADGDNERGAGHAFAAMPIDDESSMRALLTPRATLVSHRPDQRGSLIVSVPSIEREDADALYAASILMHLLMGADARSFAEIEHVRRVVEADNLLPRLTEARDRLHPADRPAVFAAESVLTRVSHGPLDASDVLSLRDTVATLDLSKELGEITSRWDRAASSL